MNLLRKLLLVLLSAISLSGLKSCQFIPDDVNFHEVVIPDPSKINLSDFSNEDTLFISVTTDFEIAVSNLEGRRVYRSQLLVDGKELTAFYSPTVEFRLYPTSYSTGVHEIEIIYYLSTGSNSLADRLEAEQLRVSKKWKF